MSDGKEKATYIVGLLIGVVIYLLIFIYIYKGNLGQFIKIVTRGSPESVVLAYVARVGYLICEAMIWWAILRIFGKVSVIKVWEVMFAAIFVEFVLPVGGATEVARYLLAVKLKLTDREGAAASIFAHRLINTLAILLTTFISLIIIQAPFPLYLGLGIPSLILVGGNAALYLLPKYKWVEEYADKFLRRVSMSIEGMSENYRFRMNQIKRSYRLIALAFLFAFLERLASGIYGIEVAGITGIDISLPKALLAFDSLYTIMWLLPALTPGGIGIFEFIQTGLLTYLGIGMDSAATISIVSRIYYVLGEYPLFLLSALGLGYSGKELIKQLIRSRQKAEESTAT
ncbi:MAG: flippase-like domain-containing protein [Desulfurococcales archaeon]|nr:flippase-like domain-containing protein [Desulfurococcales archaeon]